MPGAAADGTGVRVWQLAARGKHAGECTGPLAAAGLRPALTSESSRRSCHGAAAGCSHRLLYAIEKSPRRAATGLLSQQCASSKRSSASTSGRATLAGKTQTLTTAAAGALRRTYRRRRTARSAARRAATTHRVPFIACRRHPAPLCVPGASRTCMGHQAQCPCALKQAPMMPRVC